MDSATAPCHKTESAIVMDDRHSRSQTDIVQEKLGELILSHRLRPGQVLSESWIAREFNVSRTPAREALRYLAAIGLVSLRPHKRPVVVQPTMKDILDLFEMMGELEAACARYAARRHSPDMMRRMRALNEGCAQAAQLNDPDLYYRENEKLHEAIYAASGNAHLEREVVFLRNRMRIMRNAQGGVPGRIRASYGEHCRLLDAIEARDERSAADLMRDHLRVQGETLRDYLSRANDGATDQPEEMKC